MNELRTREELIDHVNHGHPINYLFFWGHRKSSRLSKSCLSQWYDAAFQEGDHIFPTAEHYMMYHKAKLFGDDEAMGKALQAKNPGAVKAIGRSVSGFEQGTWDEHKFTLVVNANLAKFSSNKALKDFLIGTQQQVLVEASPVDRIWGIGLAADASEAQNPNLWKGENLLGFALMEVRTRLQQ